MISDLIFLLSFLLLVYFLGIIFSIKPFTYIYGLIKKGISQKLFVFLKSYFDLISVLVAVIVTVFIWSNFNFYFPDKDIVQVLIAYFTFLVLIFSVVVKDYSSNFRSRPIPEIEFNFFEPDCRMTFLGNGSPVYFIRFRVNNVGKTTLRNSEVIVEKAYQNGVQVKSFLPLNLIWALTENQGDRGRVQIPQGMFRTVDFIKIMEPNAATRLSFVLGTSSNPAEAQLAPRFNALSTGIGVCSVVEPNTLSDILPTGEYVFHLSIASDNTVPLFAKIKIDYNGYWDGNLSNMFGQNLKVTLLESGTNKSQVFD